MGTSPDFQCGLQTCDQRVAPASVALPLSIRKAGSQVTPRPAESELAFGRDAQVVCTFEFEKLWLPEPLCPGAFLPLPPHPLPPEPPRSCPPPPSSQTDCSCHLCVRCIPLQPSSLHAANSYLSLDLNCDTSSEQPSSLKPPTA